MTLKHLLSRVMQVPGVTTPEHAEHVVAVVFQALRDRLTPGEADDVWAQLPSEWKDLWESGSWWEKITARLRGMNHLDRAEFVARVQMHIKNEINAEHAVRVVFHALKEQISVGEVTDVAGQLSADLRQVWKAA